MAHAQMKVDHWNAARGVASQACLVLCVDWTAVISLGLWGRWTMETMDHYLRGGSPAAGSTDVATKKRTVVGNARACRCPLLDAKVDWSLYDLGADVLHPQMKTFSETVSPRN
jgi:hypothetical protein